jgi:hypothetical protein
MESLESFIESHRQCQTKRLRSSQRVIKRVGLIKAVTLLYLLYLTPHVVAFTSGIFIPQGSIYNAKVIVPNYVTEAVNYLNSQPDDGKVLVFPIIPGRVSYDWPNHFYGKNIFFWLLEKDVIANELVSGNIPISLVANIQNNSSSILIEKSESQGNINNLGGIYHTLLRILGVRWVVMENILYNPAMDSSTPNREFIENLLKPYSEYEKDFETLKIIKVKDPLPPIYVPRYLAPTNYSSWNNFVSSLISSGTNSSIFALINSSDYNDLNLLSIINASFSYVKLNPTHYRIHIDTLSSGIIVVLSQNYDHRWKAYVNNIYGKIKIPDKYHFIANGYANAWYVPNSGSFTVDLYFEPQKYYEVLFVSSNFFLIGCLFLLILQTLVYLFRFVKRWYNSFISNSRLS